MAPHYLDVPSWSPSVLNASNQLYFKLHCVKAAFFVGKQGLAMTQYPALIVLLGTMGVPLPITSSGDARLYSNETGRGMMIASAMVIRAGRYQRGGIEISLSLVSNWLVWQQGWQINDGDRHQEPRCQLGTRCEFLGVVWSPSSKRQVMMIVL